MEVERWFYDAGYRTALPPSHRPESVPPPLHSYERYSSLGGRARDFALDDNSAIELIDFAANEAPYDLEVAHVHGRATRESDLVVTERDYQLKYHLDRPAQRIMEEGLHVAFGGNPIVFVGLSLSEGDVQRPLKEFVARTSRRNRSLIGFRPAFDAKISRDAFTMDLYAQYGIHLIHYGFTKNGNEEEDGATRRKNDADNSWLFRLSDLIRGKEGIATLAKAWSDPNSTTTVNQIVKKVTKAASLLRSIGASLSPASMSRKVVWDFTSDGGRCDVRLEVSCLGAILEALKMLARDAPSRKRRIRYVGEIILPTLNRLYDGIFVAALSAKLQGQVNDWHEWWEEWQKLPRDRTEFVDHQDKRMVRTFGRHVVLQPTDMKAPGSRVATVLKQLDLTVGKGGRRIVVLTSDRGAGAGALFAHLYEGQKVVFGSDTGEEYFARFFANVGFSCEVASVWDSLTNFLLSEDGSRSNDFGLKKRRLWTDQQKADFLAMGRINRLQFALERARQNLRGRRLLLVVTAFDVLFENGYPKNTEIRRLCDLLLGPDSERIPMDFVIMVRDANLPLYFRHNLSPPISKERLERSLEHKPLLVSVAGGAPSTLSEMNQLRADSSRLRALGVEWSNDRRRQVGNRASSEAGRANGRPATWGACWIFPISTPPVEAPAIAGKLDQHKVVATFEGGATAFFRQVLRSNRFLHTLLTRIAIDAENGHSISATECLLRVRHATTSPSAGVADRIIDETMAYWAAVNPAYALLDRLIIKHLAVVGIPVGAVVLCQCPEIEQTLEEGRHLPSDVEKRLEFLVDHAALVFKIEDNPTFRKKKSAGGPAAASEFAAPLRRYTVHRLVQRHVYRQLGSQRLEPADAYFFTVSLYASHSREVSTLSANSYRFVQKLVFRLIHYPSLGRQGPDYWSASEGLRAALGVVRTLFSLGVVARFHELVPRETSRPPDMGYFEQHRLAIRWMLRYACHLEEKHKAEIDRWARNGNLRMFARPPFYDDETMWLYNECGVFSLAQGGSQDALALFSQAIEVSRKIEGRQYGPMGRRLLLNAGLCHIDRGRFAEARACFRDVRSDRDEDPLILSLARGYRALIDHLGGNLDRASAEYRAVTDALIRMSRPRAASIFLRHWGDLMRHRGEDGAWDTLDNALRLAETSGYEDIAHHARVAIVRANLNQSLYNGTAIDWLRLAEEYADIMDIPRLKCDALMVRAEILIIQNETSVAGEFATRALRIATLNGLVLRKIAFMSVLAKVYDVRGLVREAAALRSRAGREARNVGYFLTVQRLEKDGASRPQSLRPVAEWRKKGSEE